MKFATHNSDRRKTGAANSRHSAFTLVEMILAIGVAAIVLITVNTCLLYTSSACFAPIANSRTIRRRRKR